jgi:hypothetical protein
MKIVFRKNNEVVHTMQGPVDQGGSANTEIPIDIVSGEEAEQADIAVCVLATVKTPFTDNLIGVCSDCGREVQHRPHLPKAPRKICMDCAAKLMKEMSGEDKDGS